MAKTPQDFKAKLAKASLPEGSVTVCLNGNLRAEYQELNDKLLQLRSSSSGRLAGNPEATKAAERMEALREEMVDSEVQIRLRALPRHQWADLVAAHPPRKNNDSDTTLGLNVATFQDALVSTSMVSPEMTDEDKQQMLDILTDNQFGELFDMAWALNRRDVSIPFSVLVSETLRNSDETSKPQPASE